MLDVCEAEHRLLDVQSIRALVEPAELRSHDGDPGIVCSHGTIEAAEFESNLKATIAANAGGGDPVRRVQNARRHQTNAWPLCSALRRIAGVSSVQLGSIHTLVCRDDRHRRVGRTLLGGDGRDAGLQRLDQVSVSVKLSLMIGPPCIGGKLESIPEKTPLRLITPPLSVTRPPTAAVASNVPSTPKFQ